MSRVKVDRLVIPAEYEENEYSEAILDACGEYGTAVYPISENTRFTTDGVTYTVYAPLGVGDPNESCLLIFGDCGNYEFLVTGDASGSVERRLVSFYELGDIELFIAGHHGAASSTTAALLDTVTPDTVFVSAGAGNSYGHPADSVLERLAERNIDIYRTDLDGTVAVTVVRDDG